MAVIIFPLTTTVEEGEDEKIRGKRRLTYHAQRLVRKRGMRNKRRETATFILRRTMTVEEVEEEGKEDGTPYMY